MSGDLPTVSLDSGGGGAAEGAVLAPGDVVGRYAVRRVIGEGGFGVVYEAEQTEPVRRAVALKVIKPGMDSRAVVARFEAERQALALMDHPNIARVLDGGATGEGRPYFVMELVRGAPLTEHCDRHRLSLEARLRLFITICEAVQHAHAKGVVHRDLKPANILVSYEDGKSVPKVIDFGVAKALHAPLTARTMFTELGQLVGTPEYMSPEQAEMGVQGIDTRSDVYALGVILYELLSGSRPFQPESLRAAGYAEIQRIIREVDPPRPSTRLSTLVSASGEDATRIAGARRTDSGTLARVLRRDLDWVVMRCLEKDRERRYPAASELAEDLRRFLNNEPVAAGPPSAVYRARKFVRRHRLGVALAGAGVLALGVLAGVMWVSAAREARLRAEAEAQRLAAERASRVSAAVTDYFKASLGSAAPDTLGVGVTIAEVLAGASERAGPQFADDPVTEAAVRQALGQTWLELGDLARAERELDRALALRERAAGPDDPAALETVGALVELGWRRGSGDESLALSERLVEAAQRRPGPRTAAHADALDRLASSMKYLGDDRGARETYAASLEIREELGQAATPAALWTAFNVALLDVNAGELDRALEAFDRVLGAARRGDPGTVELRASAAVERATVLYRQGELEQAYADLAPTVDAMREALGPTHWRTREAMANLASLSARLGHADRAEALYREVLPGYRRIRGLTHPHTIAITNRLAALVDGAEACALVRRALEDLESDPEVERARVEDQRETVRRTCEPETSP